MYPKMVQSRRFGRGDMYYCQVEVGTYSTVLHGAAAVTAAIVGLVKLAALEHSLLLSRRTVQ